MKQLIEDYNIMVAKVEDFMYKRILPPLFKLILFGLQLTLVWAFYQTVKNVIGELF